MTFALVTDDTPSEITTADIAVRDIRFSYATMLLWSDEERAACGIYKIEDDHIPDGKVAVGAELTFENGTVRRTFTLEDAPLPPVPGSVTPTQGRLALLAAGKLADVKAAVNAADEATQIWFEYATVWERSNPILEGLGAALGLSSAEIDTLFRQASEIA